MSGITSGTALWYASRATGIISLVLLTAVMVLGILVNPAGPAARPAQVRGPPGCTANLSLLAVGFVAVHVATAIADPFVTIGLAAGVYPARVAVPLGVDRPWCGVLDLIIALIVTSLARARDRPQDVAGRALAGLRILAGGARAQHRQAAATCKAVRCLLSPPHARSP